MDYDTKIIEAFVGKKYDGISSASEILTEIMSSPAQCYDCRIDHEEDDEFVVQSSFRFRDFPITAHIYYGYNTLTVLSVKFNGDNGTNTVKDLANRLIDDFIDVLSKVIIFSCDERSADKEGLENLTIAEIKDLVSKIPHR